MKVLLLTDVAGCGRRFEVREVASGFARNYLLPRGLAELADALVLKRAEELKKQAEIRQAKDLTELRQMLDKLSKIKITIKAKTNKQGGLFEGLDQKALAQAVEKETRLALKPDWIELEQPLKAMGEYSLVVKPSWPGVENLSATLVVEVQPLEA